MRIQGFYNAAQDRVLLKLQELPPSGDVNLWLTRRQLLALVLACQRVRSTMFDPGVGRPLRSNSLTGGTLQAADSGSEREEPVNAALVEAVKFRRIPGGLRLELKTAPSRSFVLFLKGDNLASFENMVNHLGVAAKWDLSAGLLRMGSAGIVTSQKHLLH